MLPLYALDQLGVLALGFVSFTCFAFGLGLLVDLCGGLSLR
jgi:hypothetical protein